MLETRPYARLLLLAAALCVAGAPARAAEDRAVADVVVVVDTSTSMKETGMDPERTSLLVTQLLADIVPGELAVVRLLDLMDDGTLLPNRETGEMQPCVDDPSRMCGVVEPASDWYADARRGKYGTLTRPSRGDPGFKKGLEAHLEQRSANSEFALAFAAAQGVFDDHSGSNSEVPRTVIWLSDGRSEDEPATRRKLNELVAEGVAVEAIVFGAGDPRLAHQVGIPVERAANPAELMKAFAGAFRRIVQAPYELDASVTSAPGFEMKPQVSEAWVVVYGDDSLREANLDGPSGAVAASYAEGLRAGAGAYRVAYLEAPAAGRWALHADGGGAGVAYAVVQRSALAPKWLEPRQAAVGLETPLVAAVVAGHGNDLIIDPEVLSELRLTATVAGETLTLRDDGSGGDETAGDGRFTALHTFQTAGSVPVKLRLEGEIVDRTTEATVEVSGFFRLTGGPQEVDFGSLAAGETACRPLEFTAEQEGEVPFTLQIPRALPPDHRLEVRLPRGTLVAAGDPTPIAVGDPIQVCLVTSRHAPSSSASVEPWLQLVAAGGGEGQRLEVPLSWEVRGLTFWQRWGWLILTILAVLALLAVILGFVLPHRFQPGLAVSFAPERGDLDEQTPQPLRQWKGVGIGFYRDARAFLHSDFRLSGNPRGALAVLHAQRHGTRVEPGKGTSLARESIDGDWEPVAAAGRRTRGGDIYRVSDRGPYFRVSSRGGRG